MTLSDDNSLPPPFPLDAAGNVDSDVLCIECHYNLRTLHRDGLCPECGLPVGRSIRGNLLPYQDPRWLGRLGSGINWLVTSVVIAIGLVVILLLAEINSRPGRRLPVTNPGYYLMFQVVSSLVVGGIGAIGMWRLTTPDPRMTRPERLCSARRLSRITALAWFVLSQSQATVARFPLLGSAVEFAHTVIGAVGAIATLAYFRQLAVRIPDESMARQTRIVMWGFVALVALFGLGSICARIARIQGFGQPESAAMVVMTFSTCLAIPLGIIFAVWFLVLLFKYRRDLNDAAYYARSSWASRDLASPLRRDVAKAPAPLAGEPPAADN